MTAFELFADINTHILEDEKPSIFLNGIYLDPLFREHPFSMLYELKKTEQSPIHHPEGNVWNHTMLVLDEAANQKVKSNNKVALMWAALLHDIGKPSTMKIRKGKITAYDHDKLGAALAKEFLQTFTDDAKFVNEVYQLIRYHMQILFVVKDLHFADIEGLKLNTDIKELALLGLCNRLGRQGSDRTKEEKNIELFLQKCIGS